MTETQGRPSVHDMRSMRVRLRERPGVGRAGRGDGCAPGDLARYPGLRVCGTQHGYFSLAEEAQVIDAIRRSGAQVLLAAFGAPRQEKWIDDHREALGVSVQMGVGGLLDF